MDVTAHPLRLAQQPEADALLSRSPLAALTGMLLDQQIPMEWAFTGPYTIARRLGRDDLDAHEIAAHDPEAFEELCARKPAVHRYPAAMAKRVQLLCRYLVEHYDGDVTALWQDAGTGRELLARLEDLPGFGKQKARIFLALLGKQLGVRPEGWRAAAGPYGEEGSRRSVADITGPDSLAEVRAYKQEAKRAAKAKKG
ncbi:Fe-S cluster assembly protein HesB [Streptomyces sp. AV19]|uniref:HhH-GPD-type base excision DNA repair protein n=1 Tax=Streptomyces sp. AV19 TaxID=2793068 RepID=UPI0018FF0D24|nr:HhH-GPD-type base excision DNA repair protein [Streptomyces sp. AV19]MBH1934807.1 Fe-S cluster assembly protein HesB [Streptomyces sp. AV19]MDG4530588.1 Fe-S cluster assembly protein HesB [Streptomyces sp. AV19]